MRMLASAVMPATAQIILLLRLLAGVVRPSANAILVQDIELLC